ncbi:HAMP domain-containing sensor histidine kinase [Mycobacterium sp. JS623]|uniref:HAMP domain-containing sensor histidine kinase n=1 Tax=Mycobacterium sp. JS623 TaxID=212767 RepID=UPI003FA5B602
MATARSTTSQTSSGRRSFSWLSPLRWSIAARSAFIAGAVVFIALALAGAALTAALYQALLSGVDDAASRRVGDVVAGLGVDSAADLDAALLDTDQRIVAVQVLDDHGNVVTRSGGAPAFPLVAPSKVGSTMRVGLTDDEPPDNDQRVSGRIVDTKFGRYTVLVAGDTEAAESTVRSALVLLAGACPVVVAVAAISTYRLMRRSLRSVDAIRGRVADISTSDLTERVPVPPGRDEISALATTMNDMLARIESGHAAQRQFVGDASHELRSPLTAIISALDVAVAHPEVFDLKLTTSTLVPEAERMRVLVEDLLLLARADEGRLAVHREPVRLDDIATGEVARQRRIGHRDIDISAEPTELGGDSAGLSRLVRNLLENAARHARSRVELTVRIRGENAIVTVADDGPGIPECDRTRVFDRFVRLDRDRARSSGGTGLGLAIVAEITTAHGGTVTIDDRPGGGTVVTVQLPLTKLPDSKR